MLSLDAARTANKPEIVRDTVFPQQFTVEGEVDAAFKDFKSAIAQNIKANLALLDQLPPIKTLDMNKVRDYLEKTIQSELQKDPFFEKSVALRRYATDMWTHVQSYFKEIFSHHEDLKKHLDSAIFGMSRMYLNSNLPLRFLKTSEDSLLVAKDYVDIYDKRIRKERLDLLVNRNNQRKFIRLCEDHNRWIKPFRERLQNTEKMRIKLIWYVDFSNSTKVEEVFEEKIIKSSRLDMTVLASLVDDLRMQVDELEKLVEPRIEFHPFELSDNKHGALTIRRLMELLNTSEG